jgi:hypothetical protein
MLGHTEFAFYGDMRWSVCPPVLAWLPGKDRPTAVLCGARDPSVLERIRAAADELDLGAEYRRQPGSEGPEAVFVSAPTHEAAGEFAALTGMNSEVNAAGRIARCLPSLHSYLQLSAEVPGPSGYSMQFFDTDRLQWVEASSSSGEGLYSYAYFRPEYRLKVDGTCLRVTREAGIYELLRRRKRRVLEYDADSRQLVVPVRAALPDLPARAAVLSSGMLPSFSYQDGQPVHIYHEVPVSIAQAIFTSTGQTLEE